MGLIVLRRGNAVQFPANLAPAGRTEIVAKPRLD
jgi:hypothetical protein